MTNKQANNLIGKPITVKHRVSGDQYNIVLVKRWNGTIYFIKENVFGIEQSTIKPVFNIYPVDLVEGN